MKNLTPQKLRCMGGACPSVHQLDDGKLLIVGAYFASGSPRRVAVAIEEVQGHIRKTDNNFEAAILIDPELLDDFCVRRAAQQKDETVSPSALQSGDSAEAMLTGLERKMLDFITSYLRTHEGQSPTLAEIGEGCGVSSVGTIHRYVSSIEAKGFLTKARSGWRTRRIAQAALQSGDSAEAVASDGNPAVAGWLPHYADPLDVLTWQLSEAFGATISEKQWLAARALLDRFEPEQQAFVDFAADAGARLKSEAIPSDPPLSGQPDTKCKVLSEEPAVAAVLADVKKALEGEQADG